MFIEIIPERYSPDNGKLKTEYDKFHEKELFYLKSKNNISLATLRDVLGNLRIAEMDDFFYLPRTGEFPDWQSINVLNIAVFNNESQLTLENCESWNKLKIKYLFATLPFVCMEQVLDVIFEIAHALDLSVEHNGQLATREHLVQKFNEYRGEVLTALDGEPGSEVVRINILRTYPRNK